MPTQCHNEDDLCRPPPFTRLGTGTARVRTVLCNYYVPGSSNLGLSGTKRQQRHVNTSASKHKTLLNTGLQFL